MCTIEASLLKLDLHQHHTVICILSFMNYIQWLLNYGSGLMDEWTERWTDGWMDMDKTISFCLRWGIIINKRAIVALNRSPE